MSTILFDPVKTAACITDRVVVLLSGGKDSVVTLDLCCRFFKNVTAVFMYIVPGLSFNEQLLRYYERRCQIDIKRIPHFMISGFMRYGTLRPMDMEVPIVSTKEIYNYIRYITGTYWLCGGERASDSIIRNAMIRKSGSIDSARGRIYPIAYWKKKDVVRYIDKHKLLVSPESKFFGHSFRSLMGDELRNLKRYFPEDFERVVGFFPLAEASVRQYEFEQTPDF